MRTPLAALIWKDYKGWTARVMPYALLTCATLGLGLFMGGYWAYETQGWHGFWAWDPVENASFFPWLAITALVHGLVVQKSRDGMARTNTFLGLLAFWLFLLGTFLTRSGALAEKSADGALLSVHAFDNISKSGLFLMEAMLVLYGLGGLVMWIARLRKMPTRPTTGETLVSRDFAFFVSMMLMILACAVITFGTTTPLFMSWLHRRPTQPQPFFYNQVMLPLTVLFTLALGCVPWLAWKRTDTEKFLRKLLVPWLLMVAFGFFMIFWVQGATVGLQQAMEPGDYQSTLHYWFGADFAAHPCGPACQSGPVRRAVQLHARVPRPPRQAAERGRVAGARRHGTSDYRRRGVQHVRAHGARHGHGRRTGQRLLWLQDRLRGHDGQAALHTPLRCQLRPAQLGETARYAPRRGRRQYRIRAARAKPKHLCWNRAGSFTT